MSPVYQDVCEQALDLFQEAGRRRRLAKLSVSAGDRRTVLRTRLLEPIERRGVRVLRAEWPDEGAEWLHRGTEVQGFFVLRGETFAFETAVVDHAEGVVAFTWPERVARVLRRRHPRVNVKEVIGVTIEVESAAAERGGMTLGGILQDLSVGGASVAIRAERRDLLVSGARFWLSFRLPTAALEQMRLPAVLCHRIDGRGGKRIKAGFRFATQAPAGQGREPQIEAALDEIARYITRMVDHQVRV